MKKTSLPFLSLLVMVLMLSFSKAQAQSPFITTWATTAPNESITIPCNGGGYFYTVDWGDGTSSLNQTGSASHIYALPGTYTVAISGLFPQIFFNYGGDKLKIKSIEQWGDIAWTSMQDAFYGCANLVCNATDAPDLSGVTSMFGMFAYATAFTGNLNNWDVSTITDMTHVFGDTHNFNGDISSWDVSNVTSLNAMFLRAYAFNQDISNWDVSNVTNMSFMFGDAVSFNQNIGSWAVDSVTTMNRMFLGASSFNQNIGSWHVGNVTNMFSMFQGATAFNQNIGNWDVSKVSNMQRMFYDADAFNQDLNLWDVSSVSNMWGMFSYTDAFNGNISNWDISSVTNFGEMFLSAKAFNQNISSWDVSNATSMYAMFRNTSAFSQNLGSWTLNPNVDLGNMFHTAAGMGMDCGSFAQTLNGWATNVNTPDNRTLGVDNRGLSLSATTAMALLTAKGWTFTGTTSPCIALSMNLIDFQATANHQDRSVELTWVTAKEKDNARFELLRSVDGIDWTIIGSVNGNGTVDSKREYHFTDNQPETKNYYRLNQIDFDGKESASVIRFVAFGSSASATTRVYPNPTNGVITIASEAGQAYSITDLYGRVIAQGVLSVNQTSIDLSGNAKGLYVLKVGEAVEKVLLK